MDNCIFCKIISGSIPGYIVLDNDRVLAFLDINPVNKGHILVMPKNHCGDLEGVSDNDALEIIKAIKKISAALKIVFGNDDYNLIVNKGRNAGQVVGHLHFHIIPRFHGDGLNSWQGSSYNDGEASVLLEKIKNELVHL